MFIVNELQYSKFLVQYSLLFSSFFLNKKMWVHGSYISTVYPHLKKKAIINIEQGILDAQVI